MMVGEKLWYDIGIMALNLQHLSKDDLINLIRSHAQQATKLQSKNDELNMKLDKDRKLPINFVNSVLLPSVEQKWSSIDKAKGLDQGPPKGYLDCEIPPVLQPDRIIAIKPEWKSKNRLQNCHGPKQK